MGNKTEGWWGDNYFAKRKAHYFYPNVLCNKYAESLCGLVYSFDVLEDDPIYVSCREKCKTCLKKKEKK